MRGGLSALRGLALLRRGGASMVRERKGEATRRARAGEGRGLKPKSGLSVPGAE